MHARVRTHRSVCRIVFTVASFRLRGGAGEAMGVGALRLVVDYHRPPTQQPFCSRVTHSAMPSKHKHKAGGWSVGGSKGQALKPHTSTLIGGKSPVRDIAGELISKQSQVQSRMVLQMCQQKLFPSRSQLQHRRERRMPSWYGSLLVYLAFVRVLFRLNMVTSQGERVSEC